MEWDYSMGEYYHDLRSSVAIYICILCIKLEFVNFLR